MRKIFSTSFANYFVAACIAISFLLLFSSCARNGYGCHGRSKIMTRV